MSSESKKSLLIKPAEKSDISLIQEFVTELAEYEKLSDEMVATNEQVEKALFSKEPVAAAVIAEWDGKPAGVAIFFHNYSTFLAKPGLYLEDLFVRPEFRGKGIGKAMLIYLAKLAVSKGCGRFEWSVLDWNESAIQFYESLGAKRQSGWSVYRLQGSALTQLAADSSKY